MCIHQIAATYMVEQYGHPENEVSEVKANSTPEAIRCVGGTALRVECQKCGQVRTA